MSGINAPKLDPGECVLPGVDTGGTGAHPLGMIARAFEIADAHMFELLQSDCVPHDDHRTTLGMVDESNSEVAKLADASEAIREAVEWLAPRGYVQLASDASGEYVDVLRRPGEDE